MLDPLTALSVASAVVSFVDFALDLIKKTEAIHNKGSSARVAHNRIVTSDLVAINESLRSRNPPRLPANASLVKEKQVCK